MTDILCDNIPVEELPSGAFNVHSQKVKCSNRNKLDFSLINTELDQMLGKDSQTLLDYLSFMLGCEVTTRDSQFYQYFAWPAASTRFTIEGQF